MRSVKILIFIVGIFLANYVGGIPNDSKNLFITQTLFFAPYFVDFYPFIHTRSQWKYFAVTIWIAGILIMSANIMGILGVLAINDYKVVFSQDYGLLLPLSISINNYLRIAGIVYAFIFVGTLTLGYEKTYHEYKREFSKKKKAKQGSKKKEVAREGLVDNVSTR